MGWREIGQRRYQFVLLTIILGIGIAMTGAMSDLQDAQLANLDRAYERSSFMDVMVRTQYGQTFNLTALQEIIDGSSFGHDIMGQEYRLSFNVFLNLTTAEGYRVIKGQVIGYAVESGDLNTLSVNRPLSIDEQPLRFGSVNSAQCFVEKHFADHFSLAKGSTIAVMKNHGAVNLEVLDQVYVPEFFAVIPEGEYAPVPNSYGVLCLPLGTALGLYYGQPTSEITLNEVVFRLKDHARQDGFREAMIAGFAAKGISIVATSGVDNLGHAYLYDSLERQQQSLALFPIIIFGVAATGTVMTIRRIIVAHRRQIGVLKSLGVADWATLLYFLTIGLFIAVLGTLAGLLLYPLFDALLGNAFTNTIGPIGLSPIPNGPAFISVAVVGAILCIICTTLPAVKALRAKTADVLTGYQGGPGRKARSGRRKRASRLSPSVKLTIRNLLRRPGRSATTVIGVAIALALFLSFIIVLQSTIVLLQGVSDKTVWDYEVKAEGFISSDSGDGWADEYAVSSVNPTIALPTHLTLGGKNTTMVLVAAQRPDRVYSMTFDQGAIAPGEIVISRYVAKQMGVGAGDVLRLELPYFDQAGISIVQTELKISGVQSNLLGYYLFTDLGTIQARTNLQSQANVFYVETEGGARSIPFENAVVTQSGVSGLSYVADMDSMADQYLGMLVPITTLMMFISVAISVAIVYNMSIINAQERTREYATMRTLGIHSGKIRKLILSEAGILTSIGLVLGAIGGYLLAVGIFSSIEDLDLLSLRILYSWEGLITGAAIIILVVLVVTSITMRYVDRIDIAAMIRERSG